MNRTTVECLVCCFAGPALASLSCQAPPPPPPPDLAQAARVIQEMMSPRKLEAAGFFAAYPDPKPSDLVSFMSSEMGVILWPPREGSRFADELELEQSRARGETVIPKGIAYRRKSPDPEGGRQIVYRADDEKGELIVEAYADPATDPVFVRRWRLTRQ